MHAAFRKDVLRTIRGNLKRFVAIVVITVLGTAMFSGLKAGCDDLRTAADDFYDSQQLFDVRVLSTLGITQDDVGAPRSTSRRCPIRGSTNPTWWRASCPTRRARWR